MFYASCAPFDWWLLPILDMSGKIFPHAADAGNVLLLCCRKQMQRSLIFCISFVNNLDPRWDFGFVKSGYVLWKTDNRGIYAFSKDRF
jgi:hypothetical protein